MSTIHYVCAHCGTAGRSWAESCPECQSYLALVEYEPDEPEPEQAPKGMAVAADELPTRRQRVIGTGIEAWDEALGGGIVIPSTLVVYGRAGSRKSTYAGAIAQQVASVTDGCALILCPEMPSAMARDAARRVCEIPLVMVAGIERGAEDWAKCVQEIERLKPTCIVYDSIQAFDVAGLAGDQAVRHVILTARKMAATMRHVAILISQVNAEGKPLGPTRTIHDVDAVVELTPERVRVTKNRFAPSPREALLG